MEDNDEGYLDMRRPRMSSNAMTRARGALFSWAERGAHARSWMNPMHPSRQCVFGGFRRPYFGCRPSLELGPIPTGLSGWGEALVAWQRRFPSIQGQGLWIPSSQARKDSGPAPWDDSWGKGQGPCKNASQFPCVSPFRGFAGVSERAIGGANHPTKEAHAGGRRWI